MSNQDIALKDIIASKDYSEFLENYPIELSDWDKATIIYNHTTASFDEKNKMLLKIMSNTSDKILGQQIDERLTRDKRYLEMYKVNDGNSLYILSTWYEGEYDIDGYYLDFKSAYEAGLKEQEKFIIKKEIFECKRNIDEKKGVFGAVEFSSDGNLNNLLYLYSETEEDAIEIANNNRFEYRFITLPMLFKQRDIVHVIGTDYYGIVDSLSYEDDESQYMSLNECGEYSDWQVTVNLFYKDQKFLSVFNHDHIAPVNLEYAKLDDKDIRKGMLEYMVKTLYENSWFSGKGRDIGRIHTILSTLETLWTQYSDMRLGQLLLNVCGSSNLFAIEDEKILGLLESNISNN